MVVWWYRQKQVVELYDHNSHICMCCIGRTTSCPLIWHDMMHLAMLCPCLLKTETNRSKKTGYLCLSEGTPFGEASFSERGPFTGGTHLLQRGPLFGGLGEVFFPIGTLFGGVHFQRVSSFGKAYFPGALDLLLDGENGKRPSKMGNGKVMGSAEAAPQTST